MMDSEPTSDESLLKRYRNGSQDAANELYVRYAQRLRGLARAQMSAELAKHVEVDDLVQSVFGSFFRGVNSALYDVPAGEELWKLLLVIALNKIRARGSYHHADKRDTRRTVSTHDLTNDAPDKDQAAFVFLQCVVDEALASMPALQRQIVELRMEGHEVADIADKIGRSKRSVERMLQQARTQLSSLFAEER